MTPATAYRWLRHFQTEGPVVIVNRSTRPHFSPRRTAEENHCSDCHLADKKVDERAQPYQLSAN
ncbi:leucine zipper domain-containing protein [Obesumbacterium proteus]|uniref:leucine zipper domain-containing protein n=1 Tax=Obesumbacterium proteus TaxID=82983 RepID=UPI003C6DB9A0